MQVDASWLVLLGLRWFENDGAAVKSGRTGNHLHGGLATPFAVAYLSVAARRISQGRRCLPLRPDWRRKPNWPRFSYAGKHIGPNSNE